MYSICAAAFNPKHCVSLLACVAFETDGPINYCKNASPVIRCVTGEADVLTSSPKLRTTA